MGRLRIWPDPVLHRYAEPVEAFDSALCELITDMLDELYAIRVRGMTAPQIGVPLRVFVTDAGWKGGVRTPRAFVNPKLLEMSRTLVTAEERCPSVPNKPRMIARPDRVRLGWQDCDGEPQSAWFADFEARLVLHDCDHLNGVTVLDHSYAHA